MLEKIKQIMIVSSPDPEDVRRRNLLNILLAGSFLGAIIGDLILVYGLIAKLWVFSEASFLLIVLQAFSAGILIIFIMNRRPGKMAIFVFVLLFVVAFAFGDTPAEISNGSSVFFYAAPIVIASLLIHPLASFLVAGIGCGIITWANSVGNPGSSPNFVIMIGFFMLALISWLASRSLEDALRNLRQINTNLDRLVQDRTRELANALVRERTESGRSKAILESIADGVIVFDMEDKAIVANPSSTRLLEISYGKIVGSTIGELSQSQALDTRNRGILAGLLTSPGQQLTNYRLQWGKKTISVTSAQVNDSDGTRIGVVAVFRDYTREAELERMKNTFLAIVSHELRTPLNAILGYAEMLKESVYGPVNEKQARVSDRIMTNSHRLLDIVSDLLDQAQIEAGKLTIHMRGFRPADLVENIHSVMDKIALDKGLTLTSELDPELPELISGDMARLQQILVNLINNSIKFTEKGGVHLLLARLPNKRWALEVKDTGIGIPEDELPKIFEAFRQVDSTATRKYGGFGLGLTIVKQLAELMGGNITASSKLEVGSVFTVTLPFIQAKRSEIK